jgi:hypothetical protein
MKRILIASCLLIAMATSSQASVQDRFYGGGYIGMSFGTGTTNVAISPLVGVRIWKGWSAGLQLNYSYFDDNSYTQHNYGGGIFTRYDFNFSIPVIKYILNGLFVHMEYDYTWSNTKYSQTGIKRKGCNDALPMGAGLYIPMGRVRTGISVLWDPLNFNGWDSPQIRIGITF